MSKRSSYVEQTPSVEVLERSLAIRRKIDALRKKIDALETELATILSGYRRDLGKEPVVVRRGSGGDRTSENKDQAARAQR